jgi:hypothetical protein
LLALDNAILIKIELETIYSVKQMIREIRTDTVPPTFRKGAVAIAKAVCSGIGGGGTFGRLSRLKF